MPHAAGVGARRFLDRLFALIELGGESGFGGFLCCYGGLLDSVSCGRARWCGQVGQLQIHRLDRHCPVLPPAKFVLL